MERTDINTGGQEGIGYRQVANIKKPQWLLIDFYIDKVERSPARKV